MNTHTVNAERKSQRNAGLHSLIPFGNKVEPDVILIGTGSEVGLCIKAHEQLAKEGSRRAS